MRKSAEDIELSCDESVTFGVSADERRRYADLILSSAGDGRGFTTCLSAKASSLRLPAQERHAARDEELRRAGDRYRDLPAHLSCGQVALAYGGGTGEELIISTPKTRRSMWSTRTTAPTRTG